MTAYETIRQRARAVIYAGMGTSAELGKYILPDQPEHQAQVRANEILRGASKPRNPDTVFRLMQWVNKKWDVDGPALNALKKSLREVTNTPSNKRK